MSPSGNVWLTMPSINLDDETNATNIVCYIHYLVLIMLPFHLSHHQIRYTKNNII